MISLWVTNDTLKEYRDNIEVGLKDFFGNSEYLERLNVSIAANTSVKIKEISRNKINVTYTNFEFLYVSPDNKDIDSNILFFEDYKDLNLPHCNLKVENLLITNKKIELKIETDNFARFVKISGSLDGIRLSDNYFNIMPGEEKIVIIDCLIKVITNDIDIKVLAINQS